jgi:hypothetical protein
MRLVPLLFLLIYNIEVYVFRRSKMPRILHVDYREYESIPFWKEIVAEAVTRYFLEIEGDHPDIKSLKISSVSQMVGKRFRVEISPVRSFDKDLLTAHIIMSLRNEEVETIAQKKIKENTDYLVSSLRDEKIRELVADEHNDIRELLRTKFEIERGEILKYLSETNDTISKSFKSHDLILRKEKADFNNTLKEVDKKLKDYERLKEESTGVIENHKNFDGIALGVAAASLITSLVIIILLLLG